MSSLPTRPRLALAVLLLFGSLLVFTTARLPVSADAGSTLGYASVEKPPKQKRDRAERANEAVERMEWEFRRLRDPDTGVIPSDIRARELAHAEALPVREEGLGKNAATWVPRGPFNVGGRTRGLAYDLDYNGTSNKRIIAGGVSGGIYLSEDDGATWKLTSAIDEFTSVTSIAQDPNNRSVWYHGTGEFSNSFRGVFYLGQGLFKSTDKGQSWTKLPGLNPNNKFEQFDDPFDITWKVAVHPQGSVVLVAHINGVSRSTNGGQSWQNTLAPGQNASTAFYTDLVIAANGHVYATMSKNGTTNTEYGVYRSTDQGATWTKLAFPALTADPHRIVLDAAPSDANTLYVLVQANAQGAKAGDHQLFRYNAATSAWTDLSSKLPNVTAPQNGTEPLDGNASFSSQGGYDLIVKVKPDNPDVVWIGGTNLYRSTNGGQAWEGVGGYKTAYTYAQFANHHSDQHALVFAPNNANVLLSGHDGGLSKTTNALQSPQVWTSLNNGYVTTQFYAVAMDRQGGDLLVGGTQDNGSWLTEVANPSEAWIQMLSGDGAHAAVAAGGGTVYVSSQNANLVRIKAGVQNGFSIVSPITLPNPPFIAPLVLDPNDERVMYLASGNAVSRNSNLDAIPDGNLQPTDQNWTQLTGSAIGSAQTHQVTAIGISTTPANRLVFAVTDFQTQTKVIRVDNPAGNGPGTDITPTFGTQTPPNVSAIAINPQNADQMIVVVSNYGAPSLWYTTNGGQNWTQIEGNLGGDDGPSIRWAAIQPLGGSTTYVLATSTGVYSATSLAGSNTTWTREGATTIGTVVTDMVATRNDGTVVAATHGRGIYSAKFAGGGAQAVATTSRSQIDLGVKPGTSRSTDFDVRNTGGAPLTFSAQATCATSGKNSGGDEALSSFVFGAKRMPGMAPGGSAPTVRAAGAVVPRAGQANAPAGNTVLILDDGNDTPDDFFGDPEMGYAVYYNRFDVTGSDFSLESVQWFMRTEGNITNSVGAAVYDGQGNELASGTFSVEASVNGKWYSVGVGNPLLMKAGTSFFVEITSPFGVQYPAGTDQNGRVKGASFFLDSNTFQYVSLSTISGYENGAWLIRAEGTQQTQTQNQPPQAVAQVSTPQAKVGESISFNASNSTDPDGQIVAYLWTFGDGQTSTQPVTTHAYAAAGTYTISLEVTDDKGAKGSVSGQLTITSVTNPQPCALTVSPASGTVTPGGAQTLTVTYDATNKPVGTYSGAITITGNGGTVNVPVAITVSTTVAAEDAAAPEAYALLPNRPNPFLTSTDILYTLGSAGPVRLTVYDALGRRVRVLFDGAQASGAHTARWDGRNDAGTDVGSGLYFVRLEGVAGQAPTTRRILKTR